MYKYMIEFYDKETSEVFDRQYFETYNEATFVCKQYQLQRDFQYMTYLILYEITPNENKRLKIYT